MLCKELELKGLRLTDTPINGMEIMELLIRGDHYWQMVTGRTERLRGVVAIESISEEQTDNPVHYLPHFAVINEERTTTKLCIVFDGSILYSKKKNP